MRVSHDWTKAPIKSVDGLRYLATAVVSQGLRALEEYEYTPGFEFWCDVLGLNPAVVRSRCAVR